MTPELDVESRSKRQRGYQNFSGQPRWRFGLDFAIQLLSQQSLVQLRFPFHADQPLCESLILERQLEGIQAQ